LFSSTVRESAGQRKEAAGDGRMKGTMKFSEEEMRILWAAISAHADNEEDMEGTDGYDQGKIDAARALANRFDARYAEPP
jgi:hypothetical protein